MNRISIIFFAILVVACSQRKECEDNAIEVVPLFKNSSFQDSLICFVESIDSIPYDTPPPEYLVQFGVFNKDTLIIMAANDEVLSTPDLNSTPREIIKHKYKIEGGTYINGKPILVRTVDSIDVSNLMNNSVLDFQTGVFIDSMTTLPIIESYAIATYKLYRIEHGDSLTLLNDCFLGTRRVDIERPKHHW